jgi:hypothetical protein
VPPLSGPSVRTQGSSGWRTQCTAHVPREHDQTHRQDAVERLCACGEECQEVSYSEGTHTHALTHIATSEMRVVPQLSLTAVS